MAGTADQSGQAPLSAQPLAHIRSKIASLSGLYSESDYLKAGTIRPSANHWDGDWVSYHIAGPAC